MRDKCDNVADDITYMNPGALVITDTWLIGNISDQKDIW